MGQYRGLPARNGHPIFRHENRAKDRTWLRPSRLVRPPPRRERAPPGTASPITLVDAYGLTKKQLAETIGLAPEALYKRGRLGAAKTQTRLREMAEILLRVSAWAGGPSAGHGLVSGRADPRLRRAHRRAAGQVRPGGGAARLSRIPSRWAALLEVSRASAYRAHDPRWSFKPLSGDGAAVHGGRFNPKGTPALYVALDPMTAIKEAAQGFARKFEPCVLCTYEIDCEDVVDLRGERPPQRSAASARRTWPAPGSRRPRPGASRASWRLARRLIADGAAGVARAELRPRSDPRRRQSRPVGLERPPAPQSRGLRPERPPAEEPALVGMRPCRAACHPGRVVKHGTLNKPLANGARS